MVSWSVQSDRTYKYTVSRGGKVVQGVWNLQIGCMWTSYDSKKSWFCYQRQQSLVPEVLVSRLVMAEVKCPSN